MENLIADQNKIDVGKTFESIRHERRISKSEFAELCGVSNSFYSEIIHNKKSVNFTTLQEMCNRIEVPIHLFIFKGIVESSIEKEEDKKLVREIKPVVDEILEFLVNDNSGKRKQPA